MIRTLLLSASAVALATGAQADGFNRIASFAVTGNLPAGTDIAVETAPEIVAASGNTLVYTDSPLGALGFIDITDPARPLPLGVMTLTAEPTSVAVAGGYALAGVNTSGSYTDPSGFLMAVSIADMTEAGRCALPGQPDSVAIAPDASFLAVAIENERDEDLNGGAMPQMPAGSVVMVDLSAEGLMECDTLRVADVTGLADVAPSDPEPEFVSINAEGEIVVTLQENNHMVVLDRNGAVLSHFSAGSVDLTGIDVLDERSALIFDGAQAGRLREPDAVTWIDADHFATANEGDYEGGSRGWTIFHQDGTVVWDSGNTFEHAIVEIGHYPDRRSDAKGAEPESVAFAMVGGTPTVFVGAERASVVGVYDVTDLSAPVLTQLLPSGVGPEGIAFLPDQGLLVTANEGDLIEDGGARAHVMIYQMQPGDPVYPQLTSAGADTLIGWGAISGMVADGDLIRAVSDSFYGLQPRIFTIDASGTPARITGAVDVTRGGYRAQKLDLEGITLDGKGGYWLASEGRTDRMIPHALYHVTAAGEIDQEIALPAELLAVERRFGMEGVTRVDDTLWIAVQREWADDEAGLVKLLSYNLETGDWGAVHYPLEAVDTGWVGLSEITAHGGHLYLVERDNQIGQAASVKMITRVALDGLTPAPLGSVLPVVRKEVVRDLMGDLASTGGFILDKVEGLAITNAGRMFVSTDNDGVDDHSGETMFFEVPLR